MNPGSYPCPQPDGSSADEYALVFDRNSSQRLLIVPALFDDGHRLRRLCVDVMLRLDRIGIASMLRDLPGTNESTANLATLALSDWAAATTSAAQSFGATHVLAFRGGGLVNPLGLPGWHYGPVKGASLLRTLVRGRVLSSREAGRNESGDGLLIEAQEHGIELAGYHLSAAMVQQLQAAQPATALSEIEQNLLGGSPLWLRAEPDADPVQADCLAGYLALEIRG